MMKYKYCVILATSRNWTWAIPKASAFSWQWIFLGFFGFCFLLFRATPAACGSSQARGWIGTAAAGLHHSHSNAGSEACLWHHSSQQWWIPERGQGSNPRPHGYLSGSLPLSHDGHSSHGCFWGKLSTSSPWEAVWYQILLPNSKMMAFFFFFFFFSKGRILGIWRFLG